MDQVKHLPESLDAFLQAEQSKCLLRFITCGSVDDGKSTLIGRLFYEAKLILEDQIETLIYDSKRFGTNDQELDLALFVDGLAAEREQGITIDVAYRFFATDKRKFIVADTPGHEQYTRNMATGASTADLAIVLVDARKGVLAQTKRHSLIVSMLGVKNVILAINKMDLVGYSQNIFQCIEEDYKRFSDALGIQTISIPISALRGDNIIYNSIHTPWYKGPSLLEWLENVDIEKQDILKPYRMPVQWVSRPHLDFRGFAGTVTSGTIRVNDEIKILPSEKISRVSQIVTYDGPLQKAGKDQAITITLKDEIDVSRGDVFVSIHETPCEVADQFEAYILWMAEKEMIPNRQYMIQLHTNKALCTLSNPKYRLDVNTFEHIAAKTFTLNEIGVCNVALNKMVVFEPYKISRELGSFILVDRLTNETIAAGMITHALRRSTNVHRQILKVDIATRESLKQQKACVLWMTGLSGAGKSTIANLVEEKLNKIGKHTMILDGDNLRLGLNRDLGFTEKDRAENVRRVAEVGRLMADAGLITLISLISPFKAEREMAKQLIGEQRFIEIFVKVDLAEAEARDSKGLYAKARAGEIPNFTGIGSPYEIPTMPDIKLDTMKYSAEELADYIIHLLIERKFL